MQIDFSDSADLESALAGVNVVYHLAAVSNVNHVFAAPLESVLVNTHGTAAVLEAARRGGVERVLFASTVWVYGSARQTEVDEDAPFYMPGAGHLYTSSKIASEFFCHDYWQLYGLPFTILRYGIPYGPRARSGTVISIFVDKALKGETITITGDGGQYRNFVYVEDLAEGNVLALDEVAKCQTYNLEGPEKVTIRQLAETVRDIIGDVNIEYTPARPGDYAGKEVSAEKARRELGWECKTPLHKGMELYIEWVKQQRQQ